MQFPSKADRGYDLLICKKIKLTQNNLEDQNIEIKICSLCKFLLGPIDHSGDFILFANPF